MRRQTLSFITALMFLMGLFGTPAPPAFVCRITGRPMAPAVASNGKPVPCCATHVSLTSDGTAHPTLAKSSCCDLRVTQEKSDASAVFAPEIVVAPAVLPTLAVLPPLIFTETPRPMPLLVVGAPRGPPPGGSGPRAPPFFS